jgi:hypothetical protein
MLAQQFEMESEETRGFSRIQSIRHQENVDRDL